MVFQDFIKHSQKTVAEMQEDGQKEKFILLVGKVDLRIVTVT